MYGRLDHGYTASTLEDKDGKETKSGNIAAGAWTSNRLGLIANEDLGGGTKAQLLWETGLGSLSGVASTSTIRQAFVGLSDAKLGTVQVGAIYAPEYFQYLAIAGSANARGFVDTGLVLSSSSSAKTNTAVHGLGLIKNRNMINYIAPKMGAVTLSAQVGSASASKTNASGSALASDTSGDIMGLSANYANGPLTVGASYLTEKKKAQAVTGDYVKIVGTTLTRVTSCSSSSTDLCITNTAKVDAADTEQTNLALTAGYTMGALKLNAFVANREMTGTTTLKYDTTNLSATYTMGKASPFISYSTGKMKNATTTLNDLTATQVGVNYAFSKRTSAYLFQSSYKDDAATTTNSYKASQTSVGVYHAF